MADIILTCPTCGKQTPVSEYVSEKTTACPACGKELPIPARSSSSSGALKLKLSSSATLFTPIPVTTGGQGPAADPARPVPPTGRKHRHRPAKSGLLIQILSWLVFVALGAALFFIRFRLGLSGADLETLKLAGLVAMGIAYLVIIGVAVHDNMFDGLLCIVVPLYPFYYLFLISSALFLRAIVCGLLVGFGYDYYFFLQALSLKVSDEVNHWIKNA